MMVGFYVLVATLLSFGNTVSANNFPIIGLFSQPSTSSNKNCGSNCLYIAASYVKYLESAGARVVPVNYYASNAELDVLFKNVNGFFFPGGSASFPASAQYIFDKTVEANKNGDFMPLWGTCMGFEWLLISATRNVDILDPKTGQMDAYNYSIPLEFTAAMENSRMFSSAPKEIISYLSTENVTMNNHHYGIWTDNFKATKALSTFFSPLSVNKDRNGDEFVSTIEAFDYPIYGVQWHPEKNPYEWQQDNGIPSEAIDHSAHAVLIAQHAANFFVSEVRKSTHMFSTPAAEDAALIYNYTPAKTTGSFVQTYFFPNTFTSVLEA